MGLPLPRQAAGKINDTGNKRLGGEHLINHSRNLHSIASTAYEAYYTTCDYLLEEIVEQNR